MITRTNPVDRTIIRVSSRFGTKSKEVERFIRFFLVGIVGAIVDFTTLNVLQSTVLPPIDPYHNVKITIATAISFCAAVLSNFFWNRYWTYPDSRSKSLRRQLVIFYGVNTAALFFRAIFVGLTFHYFATVGEDAFIRLGLAQDLSIEKVNQLGTNIAQALAVMLGMFWNFTINRLWTYNDVSRD
jgi:putative flippase GtrA